MSKKLLTEDGLRSVFRKWLSDNDFAYPTDDPRGRLYKFAEACDYLRVGRQRSHVHEFVMADRPPPDILLRAMGYRKQVRYIKVRDPLPYEEVKLGISFTQYLRPNGEPKAMCIVRPFAIQAKSNEIIGLGYRFECEVLRTGQVSLTIAGKNTDVGIEIVENEEALVAAAVDKLVMEFDADRAKRIDEEAG